MNIEHDNKHFFISVTELTRLLLATTGQDELPPELQELPRELPDDNKHHEEHKNIHRTVRAWIGTREHRNLKSVLDSLQLDEEIKKSEEEVFFKFHQSIEDWTVTIRGRVDLVGKTGSKSHVMIEFKTILDFDGITPEKFVHYRMQALLYATFLSLIRHMKPDQIKPVLVLHDVGAHTYYQESLPFTRTTRDALYALTNNVLKHVIMFEASEANYWARQATSIPWPHDTFRVTQELLIEQVKEAFLTNNNQCALVMAPTGFGKTAAALHAMLSICFSKKRRLFILTAKKTQRAEYKNVLTNINQKLGDLGKRPIPYIDLQFTAEDCTCNGNEVFLGIKIGSFNQKGQISTLLQRGSVDLNSHYHDCPYHGQFSFLRACRVIIGDYNHLFLHDLSSWLEASLIPTVSKKSPFLLLIDEIHNLPTRIESALEAKLSVSQLHEVLESLNPVPRARNKVAPFIRKIIHYLTEEKHNINVAALQQLMEQARPALFQASREAVFFEHSAKVLDSLNDLLRTLHVMDKIAVSNPHNTFMEVTTDEENTLEAKIGVLLPSDYLKTVWPRFIHVLGISATIEPLPYYQEILGFPEDKTSLFRHSSPFSREARLVIVVPTVDTRFSQRPREAHNIAEEIINIYLSQPGRYLIAYPSFWFLELVSSYLTLYRHDVPIFNQKPTLSRTERESFLKDLHHHANALIQVVGGSIFTEGVNLPPLQGVIIVSPHMLPPTPRREELVRYLMAKGLTPSDARLRVYLLPAMSKMIQAAGRLLRHLDDRGVIVFLGKRFAKKEIRSLFPPFLTPDAITVDPNPLIKQFWKASVASLKKRRVF